MAIKYKFFNHLSAEGKHVRSEVFMKEQGFEHEFDDIDARAVHLVIYGEDGQGVGAARLFDDEPGCYHIGRLSVLKANRGQGLGAVMMRLLEEKARALGASRLVLSAQCRVRGFYEALGYRAVGDVYMDEFCPHVRMEKILDEK